MIAKKKFCDGKCQSFQYIWKNVTEDGVRKRYCRSCWSCHTSAEQSKTKPTINVTTATRSVSPRTPINKRSPKRVRQEAAYSVLRKAFLEQHPQCMIAIPGVCSGQKSCEIHHSFSGADRDKYFLDTETWFAVERGCHNWIHLNPRQARELGFLK